LIDPDPILIPIHIDGGEKDPVQGPGDSCVFFVMFYRFYHGKSAKKGKLPKNKKGPIMEYVEFPSTLSKSKVNRS